MTSHASTASPNAGKPATLLTTPVLLLMAAATGLCVGGNYFNQPLVDSIAVALHTSHAGASATVTIAQVCYAVGLLLLVPLGDVLERRALSVGLMVLAAAGQLVSGFAPNITVLSIGIGAAGLFSVAAQVLVPFAATLAAPQKRGRAVGTVMSGLLLGTLVARSLAGLLSGLGGWSTIYKFSAVAMLAIAVVLWRVLPQSRAQAPAGYVQTLRSVARLVRSTPRLRTRAVTGALAFASVSAIFSTMALLLSGPAFGFNTVQIGLVGLAGVAGALMANVAGRLADRGKAQFATAGALLALLAGWPLFGIGGTSLPAFLAAMVLVDLGLQGIHVSNQNIIYALAPEARSRVTSAYMTIYFIGAAAGSAAGAWAWGTAGWSGVCWLGFGLALAAALAWLADLRVARAASKSSAVSQPGRAVAARPKASR